MLLRFVSSFSQEWECLIVSKRRWLNSRHQVLSWLSEFDSYVLLPLSTTFDFLQLHSALSQGLCRVSIHLLKSCNTNTNQTKSNRYSRDLEPQPKQSPSRYRYAYSPPPPNYWICSSRPGQKGLKFIFRVSNF